MPTIPYPPFIEKAPSQPADLARAKFPQYGRVLEDLDEGEVFCHPRGITIYPAFALEFATTFMECNPLYTNAEFAKAHGFRDLVVSPLMVMNIALSLGVQNGLYALDDIFAMRQKQSQQLDVGLKRRLTKRLPRHHAPRDEPAPIR